MLIYLTVAILFSSVDVGIQNGDGDYDDRIKIVSMPKLRLSLSLIAHATQKQ